jgi:hypothetical protein
VTNFQGFDRLGKEPLFGRQKMESHVYRPKNSMKSIRWQDSIVAFLLLIWATCGFCQQPAVPSVESESVSDANAFGGVSFPYVAEIIGDNVNIRSGPGTNYYGCGKLHKGDRVEVVSTQLGWSRIVPPAGTFSWISMQYITINLNDPTIGLVTGDDICVYAGSDYVEPMHSTSEQVRLHRGEKIKLLGEEKDDYCKIGPPPGAYLWVSSKYTEPVPAATIAQPLGPAPSTETPTVAAESEGATTPEEVSVEAEMLKKYYALKEQIEAERAKPLAQQNYAEIKKALTEISENKEAGKAARYAEFATKQVEGVELALTVRKQVQLQNANLEQIKERIDQARAKRLAEVEDLGRFAVIGELATSNVYNADVGVKHYRILDESGKTVCYAVPTGQASNTDLQSLISQKVGLVGAIEPHPPTAGALVKFTEIVELK